MFNEIKQVFECRVDNSPIYTEKDIPSLEGEVRERVETAYARWLVHQKHYERNWRNYELTQTDWMLIPDATFMGESLQGSDKLSEVIEYRRQLRAYDLTNQNRPTKPLWL